MKLALGFVLMALVAAGQCRQRVWHDEFNGDAIHTGKWTFDVGGGGWGNQELEYYTARPENARVENGHLLITARKESYQGSNYTSARMKSHHRGNWRYGRFEARIKLPSAPGMWPAFWMMPEKSIYGGWPFSGEIDIMELIGVYPNRVYATVHTVNAKGAHVSFGDHLDLPAAGATFSDDFHVFSVDWDAASMRFAVDDVVYATRVKPLPNGATWPFDQPFYFILNLAVGGQWPGPPTAATEFPQVMDVDYVRAYQDIGDIEILGPALVVPGKPKTHYELPQIEGASYQWTVPDGATIVSGDGTHRIEVNWGTALSGNVGAVLTVDCGTSAKTLPVTVSPNLWTNGSFSDGGFAGWNRNGNAKFEVIGDAADGDGAAARVTVTQTGPNPWSVQLSRPNIKLEAGATYTISFWGRSDKARSVPASFIDSTVYSTFKAQTIALTTDWTEYSFTFTQAAAATALFNLDLAAAAGVYDFDGFVFTRQQQP